MSFFAHKGGDYSREGYCLRGAIISNIAHWKSCPNYFVLLRKIIKWTEHGLFKCSMAWIFTLLISFTGWDPSNTWQGGDKRNRRRREERGKAINRGTAIIWGNTICNWDISCSYFCRLKLNNISTILPRVSCCTGLFLWAERSGKERTKGVPFTGFRNIAWISLFEAYERVRNLSFRSII